MDLKIIRLHIHSNKRIGTRVLRQGTLGSAALLLMFSEQLIRVSKVGFFREQVSYFEGFILKIAKKKINYTLFNSLDVI